MISLAQRAGKALRGTEPPHRRCGYRPQPPTDSSAGLGERAVTRLPPGKEGKRTPYPPEAQRPQVLRNEVY